MFIRFGFEIAIESPKATPLVLALSPHPTQTDPAGGPAIQVEPGVAVAEFIDPSLRHQRADGAPTIDHPDLPWVERLWSLVNDGNAALERDDLLDEIDREFSRAG